MVALTAYFDESYQRQPGLIALAGYVAPPEQWDHVFTPAWREFLAAAPRHVTEYKHRDCRQGEREFKEWPRHERDVFTDSAASTLIGPGRPQGVVGIGAGVYVEFQKFAAEKRTAFTHFALGWAIGTLCFQTLRFVGHKLGTDQLRLIFDDNDVKGRVITAYESALKMYPGLRGRVVLPEFEHSDRLAPLQAADLLAGETRLEMLARVSQSQEQPRAPLRRLVEAIPHYAHCERFPHPNTPIPGEWQVEAIMPGNAVKHPIIYDSRVVPSIR